MLAKNQERYLPMSISSVLEFPESQLILVEPGSSDNSRAVIESMMRVFPSRDIQLVTSPDSGPAQGLNHALEYATREVVGVLNGDDFYLPGSLRHISQIFSDNLQTDVLLGSGFVRNEQNLKMKLAMAEKMSLYKFATAQLGGHLYFQPGTFWRRDRFSFLNFNEQNLSCWDAELMLDLLKNKANFKVEERTMAVFRIHAESISGSDRLRVQHSEWRNKISLMILRRDFLFFDRILGFIRKVTRKFKTFLRLCSDLFD